jgi:hypothetical protein
VLLRIGAAAAMALVLAACGGGAKKEDPVQSALPPGCTVPEVAKTVNAFLADPTFAPVELFEVYGSRESDGRTFLSRSRAKALAHVRARRRLGERSRLIRLRIAPQDVNHVRITFQLTRFGPDFRRRGIFGRLVAGAGTVDCAHQKVAAWVSKGP